MRKKKKKLQQNTSGIVVCDSIVMSVRKKHFNLRKAEAVLIALAGYVSTVMVFLRMFELEYSRSAVFISAAIFSLIYIFLSLWGKKALWMIVASVIAGGAFLWRSIDSVSLGFKFVYNVIYQASYHTEIEYYKFLDKRLQEESVTTFLILGAWVLALIIYVFTIYHPHPLPPLLVVFPIIEIGMYNGLEVNIFWGMMAISFLIAGFAMSTIDMGEYSGGSGGFVRKENLFFPKRQMRLKVTEKCGIYIILLVMVSALASAGFMKATGYKRSDKINERRVAIRDAVNSFSMEDLADSVTNLTVAFGLTFKVETHKLGNIASMKYKDRTDLVVTVDDRIDGAIYMKEFTGSVYRDNEWFPLPESAFNDPVFSDFKTYGIYPQDFPFRFNKLFNTQDPEYTLWINSSLKGNRNFVPYGTDNIGGLVYNKDCDTSSKKPTKNEFSYKFSKVDGELIAMMLDVPQRNVFALGEINDNEWRENIISYCKNKDILSYGDYVSIDSELPKENQLMLNNPPLIMTELLQDDYKRFVHEHYLEIPDNKNMDEVREAFDFILSDASPDDTSVEKLNILYGLREAVSQMSEYSLFPGKTPKNRDFVNYFLLENNKGYCTHYATAGVILARMAGIPARYATGYVIVGDDFNDDTKNSDGTYTITVKDNRSHAWIEVYLDGYGWVPFEFTAGYSSQSIDTTPTEATTEASSEETVTTAAPDSDPEPNPNTTRRNSYTTAAVTNDSNAGTTAPATSAGGGIPGGFGHGGGGTLPKFVKYIVNSLLLLLAAVLIMIIARRRIIIHVRKKRFSESSSSKRAGHMFAYVEDLLKFINITQDDMKYTEFSEYTEKKIGGIYFAPGSFEEFMDISLRAVFSDTSPERSEMEKCRKFTSVFAVKVYEKQKFLGKLYLKYIICLI